MENYKRTMDEENIEDRINRVRYMFYPFRLKREILIGPNQMHGLKYRYILIGPREDYEPIYKIIKIPSGLIKKLNKHN